MKEEVGYGNEFRTSWDGDNASGEPVSSEDRFQEVKEIDPTEFKYADARLQAYHLFFSSKL